MSCCREVRSDIVVVQVWMWEGVEEEDQDLRWLVEGIRNGTVIAVADGSYDRKTAPDVSGAGLVLCCTNAEKMLRVSFFERSHSASSYRGELLGLVALHLHLLLLLLSLTLAPSGKCFAHPALPISNARPPKQRFGADNGGAGKGKSTPISGTYSAQSGNISNGESSSLEFVGILADGIVSFSYNISSEANYDFLQF